MDRIVAGGVVRMGRRLTCAVALLAIVGSMACGFGSRRSAEDPAAVRAAVQRAHEGYVEAINSNKVEQWSAALADDVVYLVPNQHAIVGKDAVSAWAARYLQEVTTHWTKSM